MYLRTASCILVLGYTFITSCKKTTPSPATPLTTEMQNGLPGNFSEIHGYLYAGEFKSGDKKQMQLFATFSDQPKKLLTSFNHYTNNLNSSFNAVLGDIDVGKTGFNSKFLWPSLGGSKVIYDATYTLTTYPSFPAWTTEKNLDYPVINDVLKRGFPLIAVDSAALSVISKLGDTLNIPSYVSNADSVAIIIRDGYNIASPVIKRSAGNGPIILTAKDFGEFYSGTYGGNVLEIYCINYSYRIINDRIFVFELAVKYTQSYILLTG